MECVELRLEVINISALQHNAMLIRMNDNTTTNSPNWPIKQVNMTID